MSDSASPDLVRQEPDDLKFSSVAALPFSLRIDDFRSAMQDVYDFLYDVDKFLVGRGLERLDDMLRSANMSGMLSDMLTASLAKHSRSLVPNAFHNGHPDLLVKGKYANDSVQAGEHGIEVKSTRKRGGAVDTHGGRNQWMCVFVYVVDDKTEPAINRKPTRFSEVYLNEVRVEDFRRNERGELGTRTSTLDAAGIARLRSNWIYLDQDPATRKAAKRGSASRASSK